MSSVSLISRELGPDGVRRYRTRVKVLVHSHNTNGVIDLSNSVYSFSASKNIKSVGQLQIGLTAERNWLNSIYPNDYINFYVDRGDGQGWTRVFYGFVDSIEESVSSNGPITSYSLSCSDFQKAFEKTQIYFNPHVASRADFNGGFIGTPNIGGLGLMTRGVRINGSPADLVVNVVLLLMGFGTQFILPNCYNPRLADRIRAQRAEFILNRLSEDARRQVMEAGGYAAFLERLREEQGLETDTDTLVDPDSTSADEVQRAERARLSNAAIERLGGTGSSVGVESSRGARERGVEAYNVLNTTLTGYPPSLLDVVDVFTFVERQAIDGYSIGTPLWERQDSVMGFMRFVSNEVVNELFLDLRPVSRDGGLTAGTDFSRDLDEIEGNSGTETVVSGIQYVPAIVMREYPFATVDRLDASDISISLRSSSTGTSTEETLGLIYFGAIFSNAPNVPGRHIVKIPNINPDDLAQGKPTTVGTKHLDVAVVYDHEVSLTKFSRSDDDHYNLFEFYSDAMLGNDARFFMQDLLPIITPIHIVRHGLRVRSLTTRFGRFSLDVVNRVSETAPPPEEEESPPPETAPAATPVFPVDLVGDATSGYTQGFVTTENQWWYRPKSFDGVRPINNVTGNSVPAAGVRYWRFHNGVDVHGPYGVEVKAIADGRVVLAAPVGTSGRAGYGNVVVIYHPQYDFYSLYAHLSDFADNVRITSRSRRLRDFAASEFISGGTFDPVEVRAGDVIGFMGNSDASPGPGPGRPSYPAHLHFEINVVRNGRCFPSGRDRTSLTPDVFRDADTATPGYPVSSAKPTNPSESSTISQDPVRVFRETLGLTWPVQRIGGRPTTPVPDSDPIAEELYPGDEAENSVDTDHEIPPTPTSAAEDTPGETVTSSPGVVDAPSTRRQIARWALLNDHWYQHNLEYLAGTVEMRGAPEIRVGYRLDLADRNLSFYIEGVTHNWQYGKPMTTTLHVTRGQPTNPYPSYVLPYVSGFDPTSTQRQTGSRLAAYFIVPDPLSVRRAVKLERPRRDVSTISATPVADRSSFVTNEVDTPNENQTLKDKYSEQILPADSIGVHIDLEAMQLEQETLGLRGRSGTATTVAETNPMGGVDDSLISEAFSSVGGSDGEVV